MSGYTFGGHTNIKQSPLREALADSWIQDEPTPANREDTYSNLRRLS